MASDWWGILDNVPIDWLIQYTEWTNDSPSFKLLQYIKILICHCCLKNNKHMEIGFLCIYCYCFVELFACEKYPSDSTHFAGSNHSGSDCKYKAGRRLCSIIWDSGNYIDKCGSVISIHIIANIGYWSIKIRNIDIDNSFSLLIASRKSG